MLLSGVEGSQKGGGGAGGPSGGSVDLSGGSAEGRAATADCDRVDVRTLKDAVHYFKHACAVFGWPMHLWMNLTQPSR